MLTANINKIISDKSKDNEFSGAVLIRKGKSVKNRGTIMKSNFRKYNGDRDFIKIRDFLVETYKETERPKNWLIDRWNFSYSMGRIMNETTINEWEDRIGIWEKDEEIVGVVNTEGEGKGEAFFQLSNTNNSDNTLEEMFEFTECKLWTEKDGKKLIQLRISLEDKQLEAIAVKRGFKKTEWSETTSVMSIEDIKDIKLPKGFTIKSGSNITDLDKGLAHAKAFGYVDKEYVKLSPIGYDAMRQMPNYRSDLDLYVISDSGEIASFCTMWYDEINKIGILEPVGTIPQYRRMGLGHAVIYEGVKRIEKEGALKVYVGSSQDFYVAIGFERKYKSNIWEKTV